MPLRKIGYGGDWTCTTLSGKVKNIISKWLPYAYYMKCDVLYAPCQKAKDNYKEPFSKSFRNGKVTENIILARQARTLCLDKSYELQQAFFPERELINSINNQYEKIISWLPTQRNQFNKTIVDVIKDSQLDLQKLNDYCRSKNFLFVIKAHFLDFEKVSDITEKLDFVFVYPHADPYPLLKYTDILVTDYSSVFFDFLLVDRPIIFMCHDLKEYSDEVEFYYDFINLEIGPITNKWTEVYKYISAVSDTYSDKRNKTLERFRFVNNNL
jgi:CDP-glycerol glycerophosphotransferase (TagB/SpsB family)